MSNGGGRGPVRGVWSARGAGASRCSDTVRFTVRCTAVFYKDYHIHYVLARPNAPNVTYDMHEAARAGIRLMPDQGSLIQSLKARIAELEARGTKLESQLRLQHQVKMLRRENERLRDLCAGPQYNQFKAEAQVARSENSTLRSQNLALAAKLHAAEKKLAALGEGPAMSPVKVQ